MVAGQTVNRSYPHVALTVFYGKSLELTENGLALV